MSEDKLNVEYVDHTKTHSLELALLRKMRETMTAHGMSLDGVSFEFEKDKKEVTVRFRDYPEQSWMESYAELTLEDVTEE